MKKIFKKIASRGMTLLVLIACGAISVFLLAAGYESVYNRSLSFIHTIDPIDLRAFSDAYDLEKTAKAKPEYGSYGTPRTLKLPRYSLRLDIVPPLRDGKTWLSRSNTVHLLTPVAPRDGNLGVALFYCRSSFRTIDASKMPARGGNIFMDTDRGWRYVYKVTNTSVVPQSQPYILADDGKNGKLVIDCNDADKGLNVIVEATLLAVQGVDS